MDAFEISKSRTLRYRKLKRLLWQTFGYRNFKPKQYEIIYNLVARRDVCAVLPTGYGKSLTFQLTAIYLDKPALIVTPLISLMYDQCYGLSQMGISACCYNSRSNKREMRSDILAAKYQIIYITPESLVSLSDFLLQIADTVGISLIAIDEAHCISSYGFDFRPSYRQITFLRDILPEVPILAVTATATADVALDICSVLKLNTKTIIKTTFNRPNLYLEIRRKSSKPLDDLLPIIREMADASIIIYCITIKDTENLAQLLRSRRIKCGVYNSTIDANDKDESHRDFLSGELRIMVATIAFGMGINKSDVRCVIHYGCAKSLEGYYQEIGRAGRDGAKSWCYLFYGQVDFKKQEILISRCDDAKYRQTLIEMLARMRSYVNTTECRRQVLLEYFDELFAGNCDMCDNCCGVNVGTAESTLNLQDVHHEAQQMLSLIDTCDRSFGVNTYINIIRGSRNKNMTPYLRRLAMYNQGSHRSVNWWRELVDNLIRLGYLQTVQCRSTRIPMSVLKMTRQGSAWLATADIQDLPELNVPKLPEIAMRNDA